MDEDDSIFLNLSVDQANISSDALLEDSFQSFAGSLDTTSTPKARASSSIGTKKKEYFQCPKCPSKLAKKSTLDVHLKGHILKGVLAYLPSASDIKNTMTSLMDAAIEEMINEPVFGPFHLLLQNYCVKFKERLQDQHSQLSDLLSHLSGNFDQVLRSRNILFPSALRTSVYIGTNKLLSNKDFRDYTKQQCQCLEECTESVSNVFIGNFVEKLSKKILLFAMKKMRDSISEHEDEEVRKNRGEDDPNSENFQQLVFHIGGSVVSGLLWKARKHSESPYWSVIGDVLRDKFIQSEHNSCTPNVAAFTMGKDRGGLKYLSADSFSFFISLFYFLMSLEGGDGSFPPNVVEDNVLPNDLLLCKWGILLGGSLNDEDKSLKLLTQVVSCCVKIVAKGVMKRRLNEHLKQSYSSVSLRGRLAK